MTHLFTSALYSLLMCTNTLCFTEHQQICWIQLNIQKQVKFGMHFILGTVGILVKKKIFDKVMSVKRLQEEEEIVVKEMRQHWMSLRQKEQTLQTAISEDGMSICKQKLFCYLVQGVGAASCHKLGVHKLTHGAVGIDRQSSEALGECCVIYHQSH